MVFALRKSLAVATLALTASFLPAVGAGAADTAQASPRTPGLHCLANAWNTPNIGTRPCNPSDLGQHWTLSGQQITLTFAPAYCLANAWQTPSVGTKPCNAADPGQHWVVFDDQISLALA